jgi:hypothetical protein
MPENVVDKVITEPVALSSSSSRSICNQQLSYLLRKYFHGPGMLGITVVEENSQHQFSYF